MHALQARQSLSAVARPSKRSAGVVPRRAAAPHRAASVITAAYTAPSMIQGATALDVITSVSSVVPDTVLLGKTAASDAPTAATVSSAVLAGLAANPAAGVREFQVRKIFLSISLGIKGFVVAVVAVIALENTLPLALFVFASSFAGSKRHDLTSFFA